jgi:hypothetical protein
LRTHIFEKFLPKIALDGVGEQGVVFSAFLLPLLEADKLTSSQKIFEAPRVPYDACERKTSWGTENFVCMWLFACKELSQEKPAIACHSTNTNRAKDEWPWPNLNGCIKL